MAAEHPTPACYVLDFDRLENQRQVERRRRIHDVNSVVGPWSYLAKVGRGTIRLSTVEYRILSFLAARPYRAFTRRRIANAVSTQSDPVTPESLSKYVHSLRRQLGFFGDYIQSVPHVGYRFKA